MVDEMVEWNGRLTGADADGEVEGGDGPREDGHEEHEAREEGAGDRHDATPELVDQRAGNGACGHVVC